LFYNFKNRTISRADLLLFSDPRYIKTITTNPDLETVFLHMHAAGIGVTLRKR
jgi:hypothetical protein